MHRVRHRRSPFLAVLMCCAAQLACPSAAPPPDPSTPAEPVPTLRAAGAARALVVDGADMWSATGAAVERWRIDGGHTERIASTSLGGLVMDVSRSGDRVGAVVLRPDGSGAVQLLDAQRLDSRATLELEALSTPTSVLLEEERMLVADMERGLLVYARDGDTLELARTVELYGIIQIEATAERLYLATGGFGLGIGISVLERATLDRLADTTFGDAFSFAVDETDTLAVVGLSGLRVLQASDLANVVLLAENASILSRIVAAVPGHFVVPAEDGVWVALHDTESAFLVGPAAVPSAGALAIAADDAHVVIATDRARLLTLSAPEVSATPGVPAVSLLSQATPDLCTTCTTVALSADAKLALAGSRAGLSVGDAADFATLSVARVETLDAVIEDVIVDGDTAYVADWQFGVRVVDVGDPARALEIAALQTGGFPSALAKSGDLLLVGESTNGGFLRVVDVSDPRAPRVLGSALTAKARDVAVQGAVAYVADESLGDMLGGVRVFDIDDARAPVERQHEGTCANALSVAVAGDTLVAACDYDGVVIYDVAADGRISVRSQRADLAPAWSADTDGEVVLIGTHEGVHVLDGADPALSTRRVLPTGALVRQVKLEKDRVLAAASDAGLYQWPLDVLEPAAE